MLLQQAQQVDLSDLDPLLDILGESSLRAERMHSLRAERMVCIGHSLRAERMGLYVFICSISVYSLRAERMHSLRAERMVFTGSSLRAERMVFIGSSLRVKGFFKALPPEASGTRERTSHST